MSLFNELKRRNVFRVAMAYLALAWLLTEASSTLFPAFGIPDWGVRFVVIVLALGFVPALIISWAYELTPEGLKREKDVLRDASIIHRTTKRLDMITIGLIVVALAFILADRLWLNPRHTEQSTAPAEVVTDIGQTSEPESIAPQYPPKSIAVLPFDNRSADEEDAEFFAAGVHDELLILLSKLGDLRVISRTSVERLDRNLSIPKIGVLLNVATVLEGQVQRAGDRLRINMQLIDAIKEDHLWAKTYDRELTAENIFDVQSDIARVIADALHAQLSEGDEALLSSVPTTNTEALNRYLLGRQIQKRSTFESYRQAEHYFKEATELDPQYAQAWAAIADTYGQMAWTGMFSIQEYIAVAEPSITRALELDERLSEAHAQLAVLRWRSGDLHAAEASFRKALELNPTDSHSLLVYGRYLRTTGRPREAIPVLERALKNDPLSVDILFELGKVEMYVGHPDRFVKLSQRILEIDPSSVSGYVGHLQAYGWQGRYDLMWPWYIKAMATDPEDFELWAHLGLYNVQLGESASAERYIDRAMVLGPDEPATLKCFAQILAFNGQNDEALAIARQALEAGLDDRWGSNQVFLRLVRDDALRTSDFDAALAWYRNLHPELFAGLPGITVDNVNVAADLALLLQWVGEPERADTLIEAGLAWYRKTQIPGVYGNITSIAEIELLALKGEKRGALDALQDAANVGWGPVWQWNTSNENFASIKNEPEFQAIIAQLEDSMATQLEAIRALPYMGEFDLRSAQSN